MASESTVQSNIIDYINALPYGRAENVSGNARQSGRADINACICGRMFKFEVKTDETDYGKKGATKKQKLYLEKWARAGAFSCVVYSVEDVMWAIQKHLYCRIGEYVWSETPDHYILKTVKQDLKLSGRGKWYDVQNERWVDISY